MDQGNRTIIGSVVFVDIVGYSKKSVSEQITMKDRFTGLLSDSLKDIAADQRIILDTGDGAALSFLGDPEDALFVGMNLRDLLRKASPDAPEPAEDATSTGADLFLRIGINLGPIKLVRDINGQPNIVGDGINVAQRIMSFARPGQVVVSRSYYDVVSVVSEEYAQLFKYEGSRTDKHVREHEIYVVGDSVAAFNKARSGMEDRAAATNPKNKPVPPKTAEKSGSANSKSPPKNSADGDDVAEVASVPLLQDKKKLVLVGGGLGALVLVLAVMVATKKPAEPVPAVKTEILAATSAPASTPAAAASATTPGTTPAPTDAAKTDAPKTDAAAVPAGASAPPALAVPVAGSTAPAPQGAPAAAPAVAAAGSPAAKSEPPKAVAKSEPVKADAAKADATKAEPAKAAPVAQGTLVLAIQPWGEVLVNGKSIGVSPPLKQHKLPPGKYKIEVRNSTFTPFVSNVEVKPREDLNIRHKFN
jgi:class 3 adenylate cyclase